MVKSNAASAAPIKRSLNPIARGYRHGPIGANFSSLTSDGATAGDGVALIARTRLSRGSKRARRDEVAVTTLDRELIEAVDVAEAQLARESVAERYAEPQLGAHRGVQLR